MATATMSGRRVSLRERVSVTAGRVDRDAGIIRGVKMIGRESKNCRTYTEDALRKAVGMYEGVKVHLDHLDRQSGGDRSVSSPVGLPFFR